MRIRLFAASEDNTKAVLGVVPPTAHPSGEHSLRPAGAAVTFDSVCKASPQMYIADLGALVG